QHFAEGGREAHGHAEGKAVLLQRVELKQQRDVRLRDRLIQPFFLKEAGVLGVTDERKVRVEDEVQKGHVANRFPGSARGAPRRPGGFGRFCLFGRFCRFGCFCWFGGRRTDSGRGILRPRSRKVREDSVRSAGGREFGRTLRSSLLQGATEQ